MLLGGISKHFWANRTKIYENLIMTNTWNSENVTISFI